MIDIPDGVKVIEKYPFHVGKIVIDVLGKEADWKFVLNNLQNAEVYERLASHVHALGGRRIVCPKPVHKTDISSSKELKVLSVSRDQVAIYRGRDADGATVEPGEVYALGSGDCPTVALHDPVTSETIALHFNRQNGLDNDILEKALERFPQESYSRMVATITLGVGPKHFEHSWNDPKYGGSNRKRSCELFIAYGKEALGSRPGVPISLGRINLRWIAAMKLIKMGLSEENIYVDLIDTYSDKRFWSHRASQHPESEKWGEEGRNLVLVGNIS